MLTSRPRVAGYNLLACQPFPEGLRHTRRFQGALQEKQILRQGRLPMQKFPGSGVFQGEQIGVQGLPAEGGERLLTLGAELAGLGLEVRAIDGVAHQGVADMGEVHPDLMGPPGLELAGQQRGDRLAVAPLKAACISQWVIASRPPSRTAIFSRA